MGAEELEGGRCPAPIGSLRETAERVRYQAPIGSLWEGAERARRQAPIGLERGQREAGCKSRLGA